MTELDFETQCMNIKEENSSCCTVLNRLYIWYGWPNSFVIKLNYNFLIANLIMKNSPKE